MKMMQRATDQVLFLILAWANINGIMSKWDVVKVVEMEILILAEGLFS